MFKILSATFNGLRITRLENIDTVNSCSESIVTEILAITGHSENAAYFYALQAVKTVLQTIPFQKHMYTQQLLKETRKTVLRNS